MRRSFQAEAATGMREAPSAAIVRLEKKSPPSLQISQLSVKKCVKQQWLIGMRFLKDLSEHMSSTFQLSTASRN
uniref:Uncharacterized protein n=1 Tax=Ditylenchus dipsaci TaxID=166011 RepID=A0A915DCM6_9BILA